MKNYPSCSTTTKEPLAQNLQLNPIAFQESPLYSKLIKSLLHKFKFHLTSFLKLQFLKTNDYKFLEVIIMGAKKKSETPVPKSETTRKTPQPAPKPAQKKVEKDPSESFLLWIQEPLESLEVQINSKKRLLETFDAKTEDFDNEVKQNLLIRDQQINSLNKTVLGLRTELRLKEDQIRQNDHSAKISTLQREINSLKTEKEAFEESMKRVREEFEAAQAYWDDEKDSLLLQQEAVVEEQQGLTARLNAKDSELRSVKEDIQQLARIVSEMNKINHDLHDKIQKMNENIEKMQRKYVKAKAKVRVVKELEEKLVIEMEGKNEAYKKICFWSQFFEGKLKSVFDQLKENITLLNDRVEVSKVNTGAPEMEVIKVLNKANEIIGILNTANSYSNDHLSMQTSDTLVILSQLKQQQNHAFEQILNKNSKSPNDSILKQKKRG